MNLGRVVMSSKIACMLIAICFAYVNSQDRQEDRISRTIRLEGGQIDGTGTV